MSQTVTSIKLATELKERVRALADKCQRKPHWIMHEAIRQYVEREEQRQAAWQDAMQAWENYRATGLHATEADMEHWLDNLEAGVDAEPPACRR